MLPVFKTSLLSVAVAGDPDFADAFAGPTAAVVHAPQDAPPPKSVVRRALALRAAGCSVIVLLARDGLAADWWATATQRALIEASI